MKLQSHAKINLTLDILNRREDGYHNISTVMQTLDFCDTLDVELTDKPGVIDFTLKHTIDSLRPSGIPSDHNNIAYRAAALLLEEAKSATGVRVHLLKSIPAQSGLGGGSSNAATVLKALNQLLGDPFSLSELSKIGLKLGSDVPFFLTGGTCLIEGAGDVVRPLTPFNAKSLVILRPNVGVSTAVAYSALDSFRGPKQKMTAEPWDGEQMRNDFEEVIYARYPAVASARDTLLSAGCEKTLLCGSGSAVFGTVSKMAGRNAQSSLQSVYRLVQAQSHAYVVSATTIGPDEAQQ